MHCLTLSVKEVANYLGVHPDTIYAMVKSRQIPHVKLRNRIVFVKDTIDEWMHDEEMKSLAGDE